jgi:hypothetical protein
VIDDGAWVAIMMVRNGCVMVVVMMVHGHGAWQMAHGAWCKAHGGAWCMVHGAWCMVHGAYCMLNSDRR